MMATIVAEEIVEKKTGLKKLLSGGSKDNGSLVPFKPETLTELPQSRKFVYYSINNNAKVKMAKFTINFSVLDAKTPLETRRKVYGAACWELVYLFVHLNHRSSVVSVIRDWYPELRAFVAKPRVLIGLEDTSQGIVIGKQRKTGALPYVSPYQVVVSSEKIFAIDYVHIKPSKPTTIKDLFNEKCINLWKDPTPIRTWLLGKQFENRRPLFYDRIVNQKSEYGMYYVDFSELKPAPDDMELYLQGETSSKSSFFQMSFDTFVTKIPRNLLTVGTRQVSFFGCNLTSFDAAKLDSTYMWYINVLILMNNEITTIHFTGASDKKSESSSASRSGNDKSSSSLTKSTPTPKTSSTSTTSSSSTLAASHQTYFLNLKELYACSNKLSRISSSLPLVSTLVLLDLRKNVFTTFPIVVCKLKNLEKLDLGDNQISSIAPEIGRLTTLKEFYIDDNQLTALPVEMGRLFNLKTLMLQNNKIHKLPLVMANLTSLSTLELSGNPLVEPPMEALTGGLDAMRSWMSDQLRSGERSFRMKLMFVGQENVGKTSLVRAIKRQLSGDSSAGSAQNASVSSTSSTASTTASTASTPTGSSSSLLSTDGIDIETLTMTHTDSSDQSKHVLQFTVLDFAGQEIYYGTHQVFLTERAVYMVVWDLRKSPKESRVEFWLNAITAAAPKSPIFLVGTHLDDKSVDPKAVLARLEVLLPIYRKRFRIRGLEMVSCTSGDNISAMVTNICNAAFREPSMGAKFPTSHFIFEEHLQIRRNQLKDANRAPIMTYDDIRNLAIDCGVIGSKATTGGLLGASGAPPPRARAGTFVPQSSRVRRQGNSAKMGASGVPTATGGVGGTSSKLGLDLSKIPSVTLTPASLSLSPVSSPLSSPLPSPHGSSPHLPRFEGQHTEGTLSPTSTSTSATSTPSTSAFASPRAFVSNTGFISPRAVGEEDEEDDLIPAVPLHHPKLVARQEQEMARLEISQTKPMASKLTASDSGANRTQRATVINPASSTSPSSSSNNPSGAESRATPDLQRSSEQDSMSSRASDASNSDLNTSSLASSGADQGGNAAQKGSSATESVVTSGASLVKDDSTTNDNSEEDDAVLHNVLMLIHELGSIVYLGEHLDAFIILDPQWITKVFASILTTKHNFAKDGLLSQNDVVTHLWGSKSADFPPHSHPIMLDLLEHFQCVFKMPDFASSGNLLVPQYLPDKKPDIRLDWPTYISGVTQYTRLYDLGYTPVGLIGRILITLMQEAKVQSFWRNGMVLTSKQQPQHIALIELVETSDIYEQLSMTSRDGGSDADKESPTLTPNLPVGSGPSSPTREPASFASGHASTSATYPTGSHYRLSLTVRGGGCEDLFRTLVAVVDYICSAWYHLDSNDQILVKSALCPTCVAQGVARPTEFELRRCAACLSSGGSIICAQRGDIDKHVLRVDQVAPDLAWAEFQSKIVDLSTEVTYLNTIGEGSNGIVYKATYNSEYVSVKNCPSIDFLDSDFGTSLASSAILTPRTASAYHGVHGLGDSVQLPSLSLPVMSVSALAVAMEQVKREMQYLASLRHPNLVQLAGFALTKPTTLLLEFVPLGPLSTFLTSSQFSASSNRYTVNASGWTSPGTPQTAFETSGSSRKDRWPLILRIAFDIASAMVELHSARPAIVHGQLTDRKVYIASSNFSSSVVAKVSFIGSATTVFTTHKSTSSHSSGSGHASRIMSDERSNSPSPSPPPRPALVTASQLTPLQLKNLPWTSPEVLLGKGATTATDVYAFGIILWQLITRLTPYEGEKNFDELIDKIAMQGLRPDMAKIARSQESSGNFSEFSANFCNELVAPCLDPEPSRRPTFQSIVTEILPKLMTTQFSEVLDICKQAEKELKLARKEQEALIFGTDSISSTTSTGLTATGGATSTNPSGANSALQDLVLGRWIATLNSSNARVRKMLPVQQRGEVWCLTDLGHIFVFSMASGQFMRRYQHVLPSISSFAFCSLFLCEGTVWVASNKVIVKIPLPSQKTSADASLSASPSPFASNSPNMSSSERSPNGEKGTANPSSSSDSILASSNFDWGAPIEGVLSIKDARYNKRAGWCRLANGVLHFYKRQGELMPWAVANIGDIDVIEPHFQGHTTFLMRMKDKRVYMGGGRNATLSWQELITKQKQAFEASATQEGGGAKPVFWASIDQRIWGMVISDNIAWILLNDLRLVRWDLKEPAPSGYIDLTLHKKQKDRDHAPGSNGSSSAKAFSGCVMVVVSSTITRQELAKDVSKDTGNAANSNQASSAQPSSSPSTPTTTATANNTSTTNQVTRKVLWIALHSDIIRVSIPDGFVIDVLHAPQGDISLMTFHPHRKEVWTYSSGLLRIRSALTGKSQIIIPLDRPIHAMTPIGTKMWVHFSRNIQIWNEYRNSYELEHRHEAPVHDIVYLEHNRTAWTCSVDAMNVWK